MTKLLLILFISSALWADPAGADPSALTNYYQLRDVTIQKFAKDKKELHDIEDRDVRLKLEKFLQEIVGPVSVEGFTEPGRNNLETLQSDGGFGQADGLKFLGKNEQLFVTTKELLKSFLANQSKLPKDTETLSKTDEFYSKAFDWDAALSHFADIPVEKKELSFVRPFLALTSQDIGPFVPNAVVVFARSKDRIFVYKTELKNPLKQIADCKDDWEKTDQKIKKDPTNRSSIEEKGFQSYKKCYAKNARNEKYFDSLKAIAQKIVDRLAKASIRNDPDK